ncbi:preprotein translocase subunit SecE [bacterium]|nr:preprotein translocase subunit SecE [bacterium]
MGKRSKSNKKRAQRRKRAKLRADGQPQEPLIDVGEETAEETVEKAVAVPPPAEEHEARQKKAPKLSKKDDVPNAWDRLKAFFTEVQIEAKKINWPSRDDTWKSTWVTVIVILFLSAFMGLASAGMAKVTQRLFKLQDPTTAQPAPYSPDVIPSTPLGAVDMTTGLDEVNGVGETTPVPEGDE